MGQAGWCLCGGPRGGFVRALSRLLSALRCTPADTRSLCRLHDLVPEMRVKELTAAATGATRLHLPPAFCDALVSALEAKARRGGGGGDWRMRRQPGSAGLPKPPQPLQTPLPSLPAPPAALSSTRVQLEDGEDFHSWELSRLVKLLPHLGPGAAPDSALARGFFGMVIRKANRMQLAGLVRRVCCAVPPACQLGVWLCLLSMHPSQARPTPTCQRPMYPVFVCLQAETLHAASRLGFQFEEGELKVGRQSGPGGLCSVRRGACQLERSTSALDQHLPAVLFLPLPSCAAPPGLRPVQAVRKPGLPGADAAVRADRAGPADGRRPGDAAVCGEGCGCAGGGRLQGTGHRRPPRGQIH